MVIKKMAPVNGDKVLRALIVLTFFISVCVSVSSAVRLEYKRDVLLLIRDSMGESEWLAKQNLNFFDCDNVIPGSQHSDNNTRHVRKRGKRGGALVKLRRRKFRPPLPSLFLANVRCYRNKTDELRCLIESRRDCKDCCVFALTETWLKPSIPDSAAQPPGFTIYRADRVDELAEKDGGGGVCCIVNDKWCTDVKIKTKFCSPDLEVLTLDCRPFYLPREFSSVMLTTIYIPPSANKDNALKQLYDIVIQIENSSPDSISIILGDFNHANLKKVLPKYHQQVTCATRDGVTLDQCYTTAKNAYHSIARAPLGNSDHAMIYLVPAYKQQLKRGKPMRKVVQQWSDDAAETLRGCFEATDWGALREAAADIDEYTETVTGYIKFCEEQCIPTKSVIKYPNDKQWFSSNVKQKINAKQAAYHSQDKEQYKRAKYDLQRCIKDSKKNYRDKLESDLSTNNTRNMWQGLQKITQYKQASKFADTHDPTLPDKLNDFYGRFDRQNHQPVPDIPPCSDDSQPFTVSESDVKKLLENLNARKAGGADEISPRLLRSCADQLAGVFTDIFNWSLSLCKVPQCFKKSVIIPVPKKSTVSSLNDYRPVALTSVIMKTFERLVLRHIQSVTPPGLDPYQFAYCANRSVEDAVSLGLHHALEHLDKANTYVRLLFVDYSSAFNTIVPSKLYDKLVQLGFQTSLCRWILDFLLNRPQVVRVSACDGQSPGCNHAVDVCTKMSKSITLNTGAPQGCVLSPILYSLFTHDCVSTDDKTLTVKFADDTTIEGFIRGGDESAYRSRVQGLVSWCDDNNLFLNVAKTKEVVVDFRTTTKTPTLPLYINGSEVEIVETFRFLGTHISSDLSWEHNATQITKKAQQRLYFLRRLKSFGVSKDIMTHFYRAVIESILTFSITVWFANTDEKDRAKLNKVVRTASQIIGTDLPPLDVLYHDRTLNKAKAIVRDPTHPANNLFQLLPSGRRYRSMRTRTNRFRDSFYPTAINIMTSDM